MIGDYIFKLVGTYSIIKIEDFPDCDVCSAVHNNIPVTAFALDSEIVVHCCEQCKELILREMELKYNEDILEIIHLNQKEYILNNHYINNDYDYECVFCQREDNFYDFHGYLTLAQGTEEKFITEGIYVCNYCVEDLKSIIDSTPNYGTKYMHTDICCNCKEEYQITKLERVFRDKNPNEYVCTSCLIKNQLEGYPWEITTDCLCHGDSFVLPINQKFIFEKARTEQLEDFLNTYKCSNKDYDSDFILYEKKDKLIYIKLKEDFITIVKRIFGASDTRISTNSINKLIKTIQNFLK